MSWKFEAKVWREAGFEDGDPIAWRAQVFLDRSKVMSGIGVGPSADAALGDCLKGWHEAAEQAAKEAETVKWVPVAPPA